MLDAKSFLFNAELALMDVRRARPAAIVQIYRDLDSGW